jgi:hypothetical protein
MKKYFILSGILIAFIALTFNLPAKVNHNNEQLISWSDDTTKVEKSKSDTKIILSDKSGFSKNCKAKCDPACCKKKCDPACCKGQAHQKNCCKTPKKK